MIDGTVDNQGVPSIQLEIHGRTWRAVIDTGFNGDLELPNRLKRVLKAKFIGRARSLLAGGQVIDEDTYLVDFEFDDLTLTAEATFVAQSEILVGTHLLRRHKLTVDFVRKTVRLKQAGKSSGLR